jgi:hypothetical protein
MMDPANLGTHDIPIEAEEQPANATTQQQDQQQQQQQQSPKTEQSQKSFRASASANLPGSLGGAAASAHIGCPFSFTSQPMQHIHQLNRTLSNFLNPFGVNVEFGFPNGGPTTTTTTTTTSAENEKPTQTETRTDENSSQTQQQIQVEKLTQTENLKPTENKETTTTSSSSTTTSFTTANGGNMEGDIPVFVSQNRELFAKIAASAAAGAAANTHAAHSAAVDDARAATHDAHAAAHAAALAAHSAMHSAKSSMHSAEMAASLASSAAPSVIDVSVPAITMEPFVVDCDEKSPTESINGELLGLKKNKVQSDICIPMC